MSPPFIILFCYYSVGHLVENITGEKMIPTTEIKRSIGHYIIYTIEAMQLLKKRK